jgi:transcriptional regulator with XRE-family HTH domain
MITGAQIRQARELLGWTRYRLAPRAGMGHTLLSEVEKGIKTLDGDKAMRLRAVLEEAGIDFPADGGNAGVRLRMRNGAGVELTNGDEPA